MNTTESNEAETPKQFRPTSGDGGWTLGAITELMETQRKREDEAHAKFQELLGEPDAVFAPDGEDVPSLGMWRTHGGILVIPKSKNGYNPHSVRQYTDTEIDIMFQVRQRQFTRV